jgi:hypothetical protein
MTYDSRERSIQDGKPVELFEFTYGTTTQRYTSAAADFVLGADTFTRDTLQRSDVETSGERARNNLTIQCRRDFPIADLFRVQPPTDVIQFVLRRVHRDDLDPAVLWMGRVLNCEWAGAQATLHCEPVSSSLRRPGLRRLYQANCPHVLYRIGDGQCNLDRAAHSTITTVVSSAGLALNVAALGAKPWAGGFVEWAGGAGGVTERRFITGFAGLQLQLSQAFVGIPNGAPVTVSPGCNHTMAMCHGTYANSDNYGGVGIFTPTKNPFDGTPVY